MIKEYGTLNPDLSQHCFIADSSDVVGNVSIEYNSSVWFHATIRGDLDSITIGSGTCFQEQSVVHTTTGYPVEIGNNVIVGHGAIIHGAKIRDGALIGMGSILMNGAIVGEGSIIGAGSLVTENTIIPPGVVAYGNPCKVIRNVTKDEKKDIEISAKRYVELSKEYIK